MPEPRRLEERKQQITELYASGLSLQEVAVRTDVHWTSVRRALRAWGIPIRNRAGSRKLLREIGRGVYATDSEMWAKHYALIAAIRSYCPYTGWLPLSGVSDN